MGFRRKKREELRIELTSMVDVVFLLLIFFMISTTFVDSSAIGIKLPQATSRSPEQPSQEVRVYLEKNGLVHLNDRLINLEALSQHLAEYRGRAAETAFVLVADESARHGRVVTIMDMAQQAGFTRLAIATQPAGKE
ncbi:MAG: biopolymer transporter ExbD [Desulfuromonadaceae bacterium]|nr:biopolymer transporter ExbD [Desulfuromonadaceae bacterium]